MTDANREESLISSKPLVLSRKARRLAERAETSELSPIEASPIEPSQAASTETISPADVAAQLAQQIASARATQPVGRVPSFAGTERSDRHPRRAARRAAAAQAARGSEFAQVQHAAIATPRVSTATPLAPAVSAQLAAREAVTGMITPITEPPALPTLPTVNEPRPEIETPIVSIANYDEVVAISAEPMLDETEEAEQLAKRTHRHQEQSKLAADAPEPQCRASKARWVPRLAMLGAMATVTIALPLIGIMPSDANGAMALEAKDYLSSSELSSGVQLLEQAQYYQQVPVLLAADPDGEVRERLETLGDRASRSEERTGLLGCDGVRHDGGENGKLPDSWLCTLWNPSVEVRADAAVALNELNELYRNKFGANMCLTSGYRTYSQQLSLKKQKPFLAAPAGKSNHGEGLAVDFCGPLNAGGSVQWNWLKNIGPNYGWDNPKWAQRGGQKYEPWHWEFVGGGAK